jgi:alkylation response protein AidB-like acyl-CoA dehydrogenase
VAERKTGRDFFLTEDQVMVRDLAKQVAADRILPIREHYDEEEEFPWEAVEAMREAGLFGVFIPEEYGGIGGGITEMCLVTEELSKVDGGIALAFAGTALGAYPIILFGTEEQKRKYLPKVAEGETLAAFALSEPESGSDAGSVRTVAVRDGDNYIVNGTKQWITNGGVAKVYSVIVSTNPKRGARGASAFVVEEGMKGFSYGKKEKKMGIKASETRQLVFEDAVIPAGQILGKEGQGFAVAMRTFDRTRPGVAAQALGIAQGALDATVAYTHERTQFEKPISSFQGVQFMLADMATKVEASRTLVYHVARLIDGGSKDFSKESAMCKLFASDTAMAVTTDAVQLFGGYGYTREYPVEKMMRDAKVTQIYEGTNQIQRIVIAASLIRELARGLI